MSLPNQRPTSPLIRSEAPLMCCGVANQRDSYLIINQASFIQRHLLNRSSIRRSSSLLHFYKYKLCIQLWYLMVAFLILFVMRSYNSAMRNAFWSLRRHRHCHATFLSTTLYRDANVLMILRNSTSLAPKEIEKGKRLDNLLITYLWYPRRSFTTDFTSVHGGRPSAEYAKLRKESLENEFGQALAYSSKRVSVMYRFGPFLAFYRAAIISYHVFKLTLWQIFVRDLNKRAIKFRETLIQLGPFYVKLGQALSTRPDILPTVYCQELVKLQDQIPPFPTNVAIKSIESQLGVPVSKIFSNISPEPIAAASLGQVYKAHLHSGELVAVKVQRPGMSQSLTLDALLFNMIRGQLKRFAKARKDLLVAVNEMVRHMFDEIDYVLEGKNAERFASLYGLDPCIDLKSHQQASVGSMIHNDKANRVKVPKIYWDMTCKGVLTMEWIDGIKLTDEEGLKEAYLDPWKLIDIGVYCSLRQLLEVGYFHADPHPGNLVAIKSGSLAYFDFGMMGDIPRHYHVGLIRVGWIFKQFQLHYIHPSVMVQVSLEISRKKKHGKDSGTPEQGLKSPGEAQKARAFTTAPRLL